MTSDCRRVRTILVDYVADCLTDSQATAVEAHVRLCDDCNARAMELAEVIDAIANGEVAPLSASRREAMRARLRAASMDREAVPYGRLQIMGFGSVVLATVGGAVAAWQMGWVAQVDVSSVALVLVALGAVTCVGLVPALRRAGGGGGGQA